MAQHTDIQWADSTLNLQMGCAGCELWQPTRGIKKCYAGVLTQRYGGRNKGFPLTFEQPQLFLDRLDKALAWKDLTGTDRPDKPWLNGLPRIIFLNDMGDTFTEGLPRYWIVPLFPKMAASPHQYLILTKRGRTMREISEANPFPANVWPGVSITTQNTVPRAKDLLGVRGGKLKWLSVEPIWEAIDLHGVLDRINLVIVGGESGGKDAKTCDVGWIRSVIEQCRAHGVPCFVKQLGSRPFDSDAMKTVPGHDRVWTNAEYEANKDQACAVLSSCLNAAAVRLADGHGGDPDEWPEDLRVRDFPR